VRYTHIHASFQTTRMIGPDSWERFQEILDLLPGHSIEDVFRWYATKCKQTGTVVIELSATAEEEKP